jgi:hypothetical protein
VVAIGLAALELLLDRDDLDFYKAWPLVAKLLPPTKLLPAVGVDDKAYSRAAAAAAAAGSDASADETDDTAAAGVVTNICYNSADVTAVVGAAGRHSGQGLVIAKWVALLRYGVLDAALSAEAAGGLVVLLWMCTGAKEVQVRVLFLIRRIIPHCKCCWGRLLLLLVCWMQQPRRHRCV